MLLDEGPEERPDRLMRGREIDVAAPHPRGATRILREMAQCDRLRIVSEDDVGIRELRGVLPRDLLEELLFLFGQVELHPLECVMDLLGDVVEGGWGVEYRPVRVDARIAQQRHQVLEDLRDAAAVGGGIDVQHAAAGRGFREGAQLFVPPVADDRRVVRESLRGGDRNGVQAS